MQVRYTCFSRQNNYNFVPYQDEHRLIVIAVILALAIFMNGKCSDEKI